MRILDKVKQMFSAPGADETDFANVIEKSAAEHAQKNQHYWDIKVNDLQVYQQQVAGWSDKKKVAFIQFCFLKIRTFSSHQPINYIYTAFINTLLKTKLDLDESDVKNLVDTFWKKDRKWQTGDTWPMPALILQIEKQYKDETTPMPASLVQELQQIKRDLSTVKNSYYEKDNLKFLEKIEAVLHQAQSGKNSVKPSRFLGEDLFAVYANERLEEQPEAEKQHWYRLLPLAQKAKGGQPTKKYLEESKKILQELGPDAFRSLVNDWFQFIIKQKEVVTTHHSYQTYEFITSINIDAIKGLVWMCTHTNDPSTLRNLAALAERCYRKIPGHGPAAAAISNACFYTLFQGEGLEGISQLSRLRLRIKQNTAQNLIERYLNEAAAKQGVSLHEIEDLAVDDFGLLDGKREFLFDDYQAVLHITGVGKSELNWYKPDGTPQKTIPAFVREKHSAGLQEIKGLQKQIDQTTSAQRDRIDRMLRADRTWTMAHFQSLYLQHGLMGFLSKRIIWNFSHGQTTQTLICEGDHWINNDHEIVQPSADSSISLWHPATESVAEVKKWREFLIAQKIQQPLKQAFREIYLLTDAEINTRSYSNRMAAHVLKQHQFNTLAKMRGWKYALMGAYDDGRENEAAELKLPEYQLKAEYWINELNANDAFNDAGIWNYITTDQIRFINTATNTQIDLIDVPVIPFSEVLRDVDLFVGVASVGNDPNWQDSGGVPAYRDYWTSYSFGDLSEVAKNRKEILLNLVPRLKIGKVAEVRDKFLVVKGTLRSYKIHIGSTNILMEPNDQYLCIVPDRSQKVLTENLFLPFEGDNGLSVILSKAFLLAEDDKITDSTIISQIKRK